MSYFRKLSAASALASLFCATTALAGDMYDAKKETKSEQAKTYQMMDVRVTAEERPMLMKSVKSNMTEAQKSQWKSLDESARVKWMNAAILAEKRRLMYSEYTEAEAMKVNDTAGEILQSDAEPDVQSDREVLMYDGRQMTKENLVVSEGDNTAADNTITVPSPTSDAITTVACPVGTTAQPDMTCLVTGDFEPVS